MWGLWPQLCQVGCSFCPEPALFAVSQSEECCPLFQSFLTPEHIWQIQALPKTKEDKKSTFSFLQCQHDTYFHRIQGSERDSRTLPVCVQHSHTPWKSTPFSESKGGVYKNLSGSKFNFLSPLNDHILSTDSVCARNKEPRDLRKEKTQLLLLRSTWERQIAKGWHMPHEGHSMKAYRS